MNHIWLKLVVTLALIALTATLAIPGDCSLTCGFTFGR